MPVRTLDQIAREVERTAGRGLLAAGSFLSSRIKEKISVPAPRRRVVAGPSSTVRPPGTPYYVATTPATPGAPPRKLSGVLRSRVMVKQPAPNIVQVGVFNLAYARRLEVTGHPYLIPTLMENLGNLDRIIGDAFTFSRGF
jgi:hypothetical protein